RGRRCTGRVLPSVRSRPPGSRRVEAEPPRTRPPEGVSLLVLTWAAGIALGAATAPLPAVPPDRFLDSLKTCEGIMAYRTVYDTTAPLVRPNLPERGVRSSAVEGVLKDRWPTLLPGRGLVRGGDCEPVCLRCEHRASYELMFPPHSDSFSVSIRWDDHR